MIIAALASLLFMTRAIAEEDGCGMPDFLDRLLALGDLYLGEVHGTVEVPRLVQCLVERSQALSEEHVVVSLELPEEARRQDSAFWRGGDGRSSQAMQKLVANLQAQEAGGRVELHFQEPAQQDWERRTGEALARFAEGNVLVALGGNIHNRRQPWNPNGTSVGMFVGQKVMTVAVESAEGGAAFRCPPFDRQSCTLLPIPPVSWEGAQAGALIREGRVYDYVFLVLRFTPSSPAN